MTTLSKSSTALTKNNRTRFQKLQRKQQKSFIENLKKMFSNKKARNLEGTRNK
jgi:hypothetical protein